jgi:hypothetical protein
MLKALIVLGCFAAANWTAAGQEVVHALTGTVSSINPGSKTITIFTDWHTESRFKDLTSSKVPISFDKKIREDTTPADAFKKEGAYIILFYYGGGSGQTAVAMRNLGGGPFTEETGTVSKFENRDHSLSVKDASGVVQSFKITENTVGETASGAAEGFKFQIQKGDQVRVLSSSVDGNPTALFVSTM